MMTREMGLLAAATVLAVLLLYRFRPQDRQTTRGTLLLAGFGLVLAGAAMLAADGGLATIARVLREAGVILVGIALIRLFGMLLFRLLLPAARVSVPRITEDILVVVGYLAWAVVRLRYAGVDFTGLVTASAVITAVIAFSMQDTLGNILGGIALQMDDSLQIGDWIKVDDLAGKVIEIRWRSTSVRTRNGEIVCVPNSQLMKNRFLILGRREDGPPQWRRWIRFEVPTDVPPAHVMDVVRKELHGCRIDHVSADPMPDCLLMGFDGGLCQYAVRYWLTDLLRDDPTDSQVRTHVHAVLCREAIPIAMPQYRLRTVTENAEFEAARTRRETARRLLALRHADLFNTLTDDERETLATRLTYAPYAAGDVVTRQGAVAHWLYIITSGEADVVIDMPDGSQSKVNALLPGDFFGEMALMTGEPRRATVIAKSDIECYRLDKQSFADLIRARPALAEEISRLLTERQSRLESTRDSAAAGAAASTQQRHELLSRIRHFFSI
ncbi:MAG: cyclic nucleotide-binding domain-containing protein [Gammaproteobacteria bacterium]